MEDIDLIQDKIKNLEFYISELKSKESKTQEDLIRLKYYKIFYNKWLFAVDNYNLFLQEFENTNSLIEKDIKKYRAKRYYTEVFNKPITKTVKKEKTKEEEREEIVIQINEILDTLRLVFLLIIPLISLFNFFLLSESFLIVLFCDSIYYIMAKIIINSIKNKLVYHYLTHNSQGEKNGRS